MFLRVGVLHRLVYFLGVALVLAALGSLREQHRHRGVFEIVDNTDLVYHLFYLVAAGLGIHAAWRKERTWEPESALRVTGFYLASLIALEMMEESVFERYRYRSFSEYMFFSVDLVLTVATPLLWGCALVRCQDTADLRSRKLSRILSILLTITLALKFYATVSNSGYSWLDYLIVNLRPKRLFMTSFRCLPLVFLLRGIAEEQLPVRSVQQAGRRARSVFWALLGWFLSLAGWWGYGVLYCMLKEQSYGRMFWMGLLTHTLLLLIAVTTFLGLSKPEPEASTATVAP